ncbi:dethiobiotin synthase [Flavicella sp.]|uniref:dethiobiotin synthase n=1 Tax=Flavicella sp. TaxID=2957742 RepID=UPI00301836FB
MKKIFITGISTEVGKTLASAIITEALEADYWKPIQAGELNYSDTHKVKEMISNKSSKFYPNSYGLKTPISPHAAAEIDEITIDINKINAPDTENILVIEGAGGLLVPLNNSDTILDLIKAEYKVIIVSRHYLGSINHTLMTIKLLQEKGFKPAVIFSGNKSSTSEQIIQKMTGINVIGRINEETIIDKHIVKKYAELFKQNLLEL